MATQDEDRPVIDLGLVPAEEFYRVRTTSKTKQIVEMLKDVDVDCLEDREALGDEACVQQLYDSLVQLRLFQTDGERYWAADPLEDVGR